MLTKLSTFRGVSDAGEPLVRLFHQGDSITKVAGTFLPEVRDWLSIYKSDKQKIAILVNALGASEYYGMNANGDLFPEASLIHDCRHHPSIQHPIDDFTQKTIPPYGYWTFLQALAFSHHKNRDPNRAFGKVLVACWNPRMHRVELVVLIDRALAMQNDAEVVVDRLDAGECPDVSMGCRVPYDRATCCNHKSKTRNDYCDCVKNIGLGKFLEDGRRIGVINDYPRFFDISFVFVGADKTAKVMAKFASAGVPFSILAADQIYGFKAACGARDCKECLGGCKVKAADNLQEAIVMSRPTRKPKKKDQLFEENTPLLLGRLDTQDSPNLVGDGILRTTLTEEIQQKLSSEAVKIGPPPSPNRKEYPFKGTINFKGLKINVENVPGDIRSGKGWRTKMKLPYGEFVLSKGVDGDKLDVYVGPELNAKDAYIVHQNHPKGHPKAGEYDEDKVMLGFTSPENAKAAYLDHYNDPSFFRSITTMAFPLFKKAIVGGEVDGEKVATIHQVLEKVAVDLRLEDLFAFPSALRRERSWTDKTTGATTRVMGSGMGTFEKTKTASAGLTLGELLKLADDQFDEPQKWADIVKEVGPEKAVGQASPLLSASEQTLPKELLDELGKQDLEKSLTTPSVMGMSLKPEEFQHIVLNHEGKGDLANELRDAGLVFGQQEGECPVCKPLGPEHFSSQLSQLLMPFLGGRSYLGPALKKRIIRIMIIKPKEEAPPETTNLPLLSKVGAQYNWYRREMMKMATYSPELVPSIPELYAGVYGVDDGDFFKSAAMPETTLGKAMLVGSVPLTLLYSSHLQGRRLSGERLGPIDEFVANHPWISSAGSLVGMREALRHPKVQSLLSDFSKTMATGKA